MAVPKATSLASKSHVSLRVQGKDHMTLCASLPWFCDWEIVAGLCALPCSWAHSSFMPLFMAFHTWPHLAPVLSFLHPPWHILLPPLRGLLVPLGFWLLPSLRQSKVRVQHVPDTGQELSMLDLSWVSASPYSCLVSVLSHFYDKDMGSEQIWPPITISIH